MKTYLRCLNVVLLLALLLPGVGSPVLAAQPKTTVTALAALKGVAERAADALQASFWAIEAEPAPVSDVVQAAESPHTASPMFIENVGQFDEGARFQMFGGDALWLADDALWLTVLEPESAEAQETRSNFQDPKSRIQNPTPRSGVNLRLSFPNANPNPRLEPFDRLDTTVSYFKGSDPAGWHSAVPVWGGVRYVDLYPGVDLEVTGENGRWVQRLHARPGADLSRVQLRVEGAEAVEADGIGGLRVSTAVGEVGLPLLSVDEPAEEADARLNVQEVGARTFDVTGPFAVQDSGWPQVTNQVQDNPSHLLYSSFLGGSSDDYFYGMAADENGMVYVMGDTDSNDFPTQMGYFSTTKAGPGNYVAKIPTDGTGLVYLVFLAGDPGFEDIAVDEDGAAYLTGTTWSSDFPATGSFGDPYDPVDDNDQAFVAKVSTDGSTLDYAKFLGGYSEDLGLGITINGNKEAYVIGTTQSPNFPIVNAFDDKIGEDGSLSETNDAFVSKIAADGSALLFSSFLGGSSYEIGSDIAVDSSGAAYVVGETTSTNFPTASALDTEGDGSDIFVTKVYSDGSYLIYSTYLGGSGGEGAAASIAVDGSGAAYITGSTGSADFPITANAWDNSFSPDFGTHTYFASKLSWDESSLSLDYSTFLDDAGEIGAHSIAVDGYGAVYFTGVTNRTDIPLTGDAYDTTFNGIQDAVVVKLSPDGSALDYATFLGGTGNDGGNYLAVDGNGTVYATGVTTSTDFPTVNAFDNSYSGEWDAFVAKLHTGAPVIKPTLTASPTSLPANGVATSTVVLSGAPVGHQVQFHTTLTSIGATVNTGVVDATGCFTTIVYSSIPGAAIITAHDLTTGEPFIASVLVTFTDKNNQLPPPTNYPINIVEVRAEHPLTARYLEGIPICNTVRAIVDRKGTKPGRVDFILNNVIYSQVIAGSIAKYDLNMGTDLAYGPNTLTIVAYNLAGESSAPLTFVPFSVPMPVWLIGLNQVGLMSLPVLASGDVKNGAVYKAGLHIPLKPFTIEALKYGPPDANTKWEWGIDGSVELPLDCTSPLKAEISAEKEGTIGTKSHFQFLGTSISGKAYGGLSASQSNCIFAFPQGYAGFELAATRNIYSKPVLVMIPYFNPGVGVTFEQIVKALQAEKFLAQLGEFYIDGSVHAGSEVKINFSDQSPYFQFQDLEVGGGLGIEGGFRADIKVAEVKVWAGADGSMTFIRNGPVATQPITENWGFDNITLKGEVGAKLRVTWFVSETKGTVSWVYPPELNRITQGDTVVMVTDWRIIPQQTGPNYAIFRATPNSYQAFAETAIARTVPLAAQSTVTSVLVSNVYTYTEPALAVNPATDEAIVTWVYPDPVKPDGQAHEIQFSHWNGATWSTPDFVTDDALLDGAPRVEWTADGQAIAIWERLNDTLPLNVTWDVTTAKKIEIATAVYSPTSNTWSPITLRTNNAFLDLKPQLARNGAGELLAVWRQNLAGLLGGNTANPDRIIAAFYDGAWSGNYPAVQNIPGLVDLAAGYGDNAATIAYTRYVTPTGQTTPTLQVFTSAWNGSSWDAPIQRTDTYLEHTNPQVVYNAQNQPLLVWLAGSELRLRNLTTTANAALPLELAATVDTFRIVQGADGNIAAVFTAQGTQRDLYLSYYDEAHNLWGRPTPLTNDRANEDYPSAGLDSTGRLLMSYTAAATHSVTRTMTLSGTGEIITYTVPVEGQTDLLTLSHVFSDNLTLSDGDLVTSDAYPAPGDTVALSATVRNSGDRALNDVSVAFYHGDPAAGGDLIGSASLAAPLGAGFTATLGITYTVPLSGVEHLLYAVTDLGDAIVEFDENDNVATLAAFGPDLEIVSTVDYWGGENVGLRTRIRNLGATAAPAATLAFCRDALTGTLAVTDVVPSLAAGETLTMTTPWSFGALPSGSYSLAAVVNRNQADFAEAVTTNNAAAFTLDVLPDLMVTPNALWTGPMAGSSVTITVALYNVGTIAATGVDVAFYSSPVFTDSTRLFTRTVPLLAPSAMTVLTGTATGPLTQGLFVLVDPAYTHTETTRLNNAAFIQPEGSGKTVYLPLVLRTA